MRVFLTLEIETDGISVEKTEREAEASVRQWWIGLINQDFRIAYEPKLISVVALKE